MRLAYPTQLRADQPIWTAKAFNGIRQDAAQIGGAACSDQVQC
jgi:hypothetical protein